MRTVHYTLFRTYWHLLIIFTCGVWRSIKPMIKDLCSSEIIILSHFSGLTLKLLVQYSLMNSSRMSVIFSVGSTIFRVMLSRLIGQMGYAHTALKLIVMPSITYNMKMLNIIHFTLLMRHSVFSTWIPWSELILQAFTK